MAKKIIKQYVTMEVDTIIEKKSGNIETEGFVEGGALWLNLKQNYKTVKKGANGTVVKQIGTVLTLAELEMAVAAIKQENRKLGVV